MSLSTDEASDLAGVEFASNIERGWLDLAQAAPLWLQTVADAARLTVLPFNVGGQAPYWKSCRGCFGGDETMNRRLFAVALSLGLGLAFAPRLALAESHHLAEAITHTKEAIEHGKMGHADVLVTHAEEALKHAKEAEAEKANPHTKEGVTHLNAAIEHGKMKHADVATKHAEEALTHLEAATK